VGRGGSISEINSEKPILAGSLNQEKAFSVEKNKLVSDFGSD